MAHDCGCDADEFAALVDAPDDATPDLHPDPRGSTVRRFRGMIAPYGKPTGDGRRFRLGALSSRDLPLPVKWQRVDSEGHKTSVVVGRIDGVDYDEGDDDPRVDAWGVIFDPDPEKLPRLKEDADEAWYLLDQKTIGPSVDLDDLAYEPYAAEGEDFAVDGPPKEIEVTKGRISAITLVQIPAFSQARPFALDDLDANEYADMTAVTAAGVAEGMEALPVSLDAEWDPVGYFFDQEEDGVGALYASGETIAFPVAQMVDGQLHLIPGAIADAVSVLYERPDEIGLGEGTKHALRASLESLTAAAGMPAPPWVRGSLTASATAVRTAPPAHLFDNPRFTAPTPVTIVERDGFLHYSGHVASWGVCHIGFPGSCVTAPQSRTNYSYFHVGSTAVAEGKRIPTGKISLGGGHADDTYGFRAALEHYDSTSSAAVDVRAGEDQYGIWVAGVVRPLSPERLEELASSPLSGDWRRVGGNLEMVAALAVNTPGFGIPHVHQAGGEVLAMTAAGRIFKRDASGKFAPGSTVNHDINALHVKGLNHRGEAIPHAHPGEDNGELQGLHMARTHKSGRGEHEADYVPLSERESNDHTLPGWKQRKPSRLERLKRAASRFSDDPATFGSLTAPAREAAAEKGFALPDGSYPIRSAIELRKAVMAYGRAGDKPAAKAHIRKRARALKREDLLPDGWAASNGEEMAATVAVFSDAPSR